MVNLSKFNSKILLLDGGNMLQISYLDLYTGSNKFLKTTVDRFPDTCPYCLQAVDIKPREGYFRGGIIQVGFVCPRASCSLMFVAKFEKNVVINPFNSNEYKLIGTEPKLKMEVKRFDPTIANISPIFVNIYNQAQKAEEHGFNLICGIGYRKALEFLIKDYLCKKDYEKTEHIKKTNLGLLIEQEIEHKQIKAMAKRAAWLGNDETHYIRKFEDMDIEDLKKLIHLTEQWILLEILSDEYEKRMPDKK